MATVSRRIGPAVVLVICGALWVSCGFFGKPSEELADELEELDAPPGVATEAPRAMEDTPEGDEVSEPDEQALQGGVPVTYKITSQKYTASASYDTQVLLNPSSDVIYPGSVLLGHTIDDGSYQEVVKGAKNQVTVSYSLSGVKDAHGNPGKVSGTIVPTLSAFRALHSEILGQEIPGQATTYSYEQIEIEDEDEFNLKFKAGAAYGAPGIQVSVAAGFDFSSFSTNHKYMIRFMQTLPWTSTRVRGPSSTRTSTWTTSMGTSRCTYPPLHSDAWHI